MNVAPADTWPDLRVVVRLLPWAWKLRPMFYVDDLHPAGYVTFGWLFLTVEWWAQEHVHLWFFESKDGLR